VATGERSYSMQGPHFSTWLLEFGDPSVVIKAHKHMSCIGLSVEPSWEGTAKSVLHVNESDRKGVIVSKRLRLGCWRRPGALFSLQQERFLDNLTEF
jgi:hypothetical protein